MCHATPISIDEIIVDWSEQVVGERVAYNDRSCLAKQKEYFEYDVK